MKPEDNAPPSNKGPLAALIGVVAATGLYVSIPEDEGTRYTAYRDVVGVYTICQGDTKNVRPGMVETKEGCRNRLERQLLAHAGPVMTCSPRLAEPGRDYQRWAAISLAYNIGTGAYCRSSVDRNFDAGRWRAGCDAMLKWNMAGGRPIKGLTDRRKREREICLRGLEK
jgi:lysozyme